MCFCVLNVGRLLAGVPKNDHQAYVWFQRSAESNQPDAQWMLGQMYYDGRAPGGVNFDEARKVTMNSSAHVTWF